MSQEPRRPPYVPWPTLSGFLTKLGETAIPDKLDSSVMIGMSGTTRSHLVSAMKFLGLIGVDGRVNEPLLELCGLANPDLWKAQLSEVLKTSYSDIVADLNLEAATSSQLKEAFRSRGHVEGQVLEKAIRFYLTAMKEAGQPLSPHFFTRGTKTVRKANGLRAQKRRAVPRRSVDPAHGDDGEAAGGAVDPPPLEGFIAHQFPLRKDLTLKLSLPADLTAADVERLHKWLSALPVE